MNEEKTPVARCPTCGGFFEAKSEKQTFCSPECGIKYTQCQTCGRYFRASKGFTATTCSAECAKEYSFIKISEDKYTVEENNAGAED